MSYTTISNGDEPDADVVMANFVAIAGQLGEVRMYALSYTGAVTKAGLQTLGWAICDGTTPAAQGISTPDITTTPNLEDKFISMSNDETSGTTGGDVAMAHTHSVPRDGWGSKSDSMTSGRILVQDSSISAYEAANDTTSGAASVTENRPPFYEMAFFMKVKVL